MSSFCFERLGIIYMHERQHCIVQKSMLVCIFLWTNTFQLLPVGIFPPFILHVLRSGICCSSIYWHQMTPSTRVMIVQYSRYIMFFLVRMWCVTCWRWRVDTIEVTVCTWTLTPRSHSGTVPSLLTGSYKYRLGKTLLNCDCFEQFGIYEWHSTTTYSWFVIRLIQILTDLPGTETRDALPNSCHGGPSTEHQKGGPQQTAVVGHHSTLHCG